MPSITTDVVSLRFSGGLIQNLGPDILYVGEQDDAADTGVQLSAGDAVAVGDGLTYYGVSVGTSDVRLLGRATGISSVTPAA
jgi:hypothetical protein